MCRIFAFWLACFSFSRIFLICVVALSVLCSDWQYVFACDNKTVCKQTVGFSFFDENFFIRKGEERALMEIDTFEAFASSPVFTVPAEPLINVPFYVTPNPNLVKAGDTFYLTRLPSFSIQSTEDSSSPLEYCSTKYIVEGTLCTIGSAGSLNLNATSCRITVTSSSLGGDRTGIFGGQFPSLYWCSSSLNNTNLYLSKANIFTITTTPPFIFSDSTSTILTFNSATPVGTEIGFYSTKDCQVPLQNNYPVTLSASHQLPISTFPSGNLAFMCAKVFYALSSSDTGVVPPQNDNGTGENNTNVIVFGAIYSSVHYRIFSPTSGLRYTNVTVMTNSVLAAFTLSSDSFCEKLVQAPQYPTSSSSSPMLYLSAPMGTYYFCGMTVGAEAGGVFVPADDQFTILEYGVIPTSMYTGIQTSISLTKNASSEETREAFENSLFSDSSCQTFAPTFSWTTSLNWPAIATPGTYYACVRQKSQPSTTTALANAIVVYPAPALKVTNPIVDADGLTVVFGMGVTVSIARNGVDGVLTCGIGDLTSLSLGSDERTSTSNILSDSADQSTIYSYGGCKVWKSSLGNTSSSTVQFIASITERTSEGAPSSGYLCLSTPNFYDNPTEGYFYVFNSLTLLSYPFTYNPLFTLASNSIDLSFAVPISSGSEVSILSLEEESFSALSLSASSTMEKTCEDLILSTASSSLFITSNNHFTITSSTTRLSPVIFSSPGYYVICLNQSGYTSFGYHALESLVAYNTPAVMVPSSVVMGLSERIQISGIPVNGSLFFSSSPNCTGVPTTQQHFPAVANDEGVANTTVVPTPSIAASSGGALTLCVLYPSAVNGATYAVSLPAGTLSIANATLYPHIVVENRSNTISVRVKDPKTLEGGSFYIVPSSAIPCGTEICPSTPLSPTVLSGSLETSSSDSTVMPFFDFTPPNSNETYIVCISADGESFVSPGELLSVEAPIVDFNPSPFATLRLPVIANVSGNSFISAVRPDTFAVIDTTSVGMSSSSNTTLEAGISNPCFNFSGYTVYSRGDISTDTGVTTPFVVSTLSSTVPDAAMIEATLCIANKTSLLSSTSGYFYGGKLGVYAFTALNRLAITNSFNSITSWPPLPSSLAERYLTPCPGLKCSDSSDSAIAAAATTACQTGIKYFTSNLLILSGAEPGGYYLCESVPSGEVTGANTTMTVISSATWNLTANPLPIRQYRPFSVTIYLQNAGTTSCKLVVQDANTPCGQATNLTESQTFSVDAVSASTFESEITITDIQPVTDVIFCVEPTQYDSILGLNTTLHSYPTPSVLIAGKANTITSGGLKSNGVATKISSTPLCEDTISTSVEQLSEYKSTLTLDACGATATLSEGYYCESVSGTFFANRGRVSILHSIGCSGSGSEVNGSCTEGVNGGANASIAPEAVAPGKPITSTGIISDGLENPFLSKTSDCSSALPSTVFSLGYSPAYNEIALFYVCATVVGNSALIFTTKCPTLTVNNWAVSPTSALSRYSSQVGVPEVTTIKINYPTSSSQTIFSSSSTCAISIGSAASMRLPSQSAEYNTVGVHGLVYVCTQNVQGNSEMIPVAEFLSVSTPTVTDASLAIMNGASFLATLTVSSFGENTPLYSLHPGADKDFPYASYYSSYNREIFLSSDNCMTLLNGTTKTNITSSNAVSFTPNLVDDSLKEANLCTGTPAGVGVAAVVPFSTSSVYPTTFFSGESSPIYAPFNPSSTIYVNFGTNICSNFTLVPSFTTDEYGAGTIVLRLRNGGTAAPIGTYTLCDNSENGTPIATILVIDVIHYSILGEKFIVGVPSIMELQKNLSTRVLSEGFSTSRSCQYTTSAYGAWSPVSSTSIEVNAINAISELYLCAFVEVNNTMSGLPSFPSYLTFFPADENVIFPDGGLTSCNSNQLHHCAAPGYSSSEGSATLGLIYGDCCNPVDRANVLGTTLANEGETCTLTLNKERIENYPEGATFTMCAWDSNDKSYCVTLASHVNVSTDCSGNDSSKSKHLSAGWLVFIILFSILIGLLLIGLIVFLLWYWCFHKKSGKKKQKRLVALRHVEDGGEVAELDSVSSSDDQSFIPQPIQNPLLYYAAVAAPSFNSSAGWTSAANPGALGMTVKSETSMPWTKDPFQEHLAGKEEVKDGKEDVAVPEEMNDDDISNDHNSSCNGEEEEGLENEDPKLPDEDVHVGATSSVWTVQRVEDDTRDQIALEEARTRYYLGLEWREKLERQRLKEKEEEVELGYEDDTQKMVAEVPLLSTSSFNTLSIPLASTRTRKRKHRSSFLSPSLHKEEGMPTCLSKPANKTEGFSTHEGTNEETDAIEQEEADAYRLHCLEEEEEITDDSPFVNNSDAKRPNSSDEPSYGVAAKSEEMRGGRDETFSSQEDYDVTPLMLAKEYPENFSTTKNQVQELEPKRRRHHCRPREADKSLVSPALEIQEASSTSSSSLLRVPRILSSSSATPSCENKPLGQVHSVSSEESALVAQQEETPTKKFSNFLTSSSAKDPKDRKKKALSASPDTPPRSRGDSALQHCDPTSTPDISRGFLTSLSPLQKKDGSSPVARPLVQLAREDLRRSPLRNSYSSHTPISGSHVEHQPLKLEESCNEVEGISPFSEEDAHKRECSISYATKRCESDILGDSVVDKMDNKQKKEVSHRVPAEKINKKNEEITERNIPVMEKQFSTAEVSSVCPVESAATLSVKGSKNSLFEYVEMSGKTCPLDAPEEVVEDVMSYTTTQRYYDENRVLCEEEATRRQRWRNYEEEVRGILAQRELEEYIIVSRRPPSSRSSSSSDTSTILV